MSSIYNRLGFPSSDPIVSGAVQELSPSAQMQMNLMPSLVNTWQQADIANADTGGYFYNPNQLGNDTVNTASTLILSKGNTVNGTTNTITTLLTNVYNKAGTLLSSTVPMFEYHTQRMSNVEDIGTDTTSPHYQLATGYGKIMMFLTNESDGIVDNSPIIGSFGSILAANAINSNANTFLTLSQSYVNSINVTSYSNLSLSTAQTLSDTANNIQNLMTTYRTQDISFFNNSKAVMDSYSAVSGFSRLGQTETDLIMNHIGTDKIKSRLES